MLLNTFNYYMQWNTTPKKISSHFSEHCGTYFHLWKQIRLQWAMWYFFTVMESKYSTHLMTICIETSTQKNYRVSEKCGNFLQLWRQIKLRWKKWCFFSHGDILTNPFNYCMQWNISVKNLVPYFSYEDISHFR